MDETSTGAGGKPSAGRVQEASRRVDGSTRKIPWPHAPLHQLSEAGTYSVTAGTYLKEHYFKDRQRVRVLHRGLLTVAQDSGWQLEAWAVFSNHYHFVGHSPGDGATSLSHMLGRLTKRQPSGSTKKTARRGARCGSIFVIPG